MGTNYDLYVKICERAESLGYKGDRLSLLMDIESADRKFKLRLEEWLASDNFNFCHDLSGIVNNIVRDGFPATDFGLFIPRFAAVAEKIRFMDKEHEQGYFSILSRMKKQDGYHKAVAYLLALDLVLRGHPEDVFDFDNDWIFSDKVLSKGWQTGTSRKTTRLLMNLWNGRCSEQGALDAEPSPNFAVDEIFCCGYAPYYWEAIKLRFPEYCG